MWKEKRLVKGIASVAIPSLLFALLLFQVNRCHNILSLRNPYVLEQLTYGSSWIWDSVSGQNSLNPYQASENKRESVLQEKFPSFTVHYLWCIDGHFELTHYVSVLSAIHFLQPDEFILHYRTKPRPDSQGYWRWLEDLERNVIIFSLKPLKDAASCHYDLNKIESAFFDQSGMFILGDIVITNMTRSQAVQHMASEPPKDKYSFHKDQESHFKHKMFLVSDLEPYEISKSDSYFMVRCPSVTDVYNPKNPIPADCVSMNSYIHSEELLLKNSTFNRFVRTLLYGNANVVPGLKHMSAVIPNIVHIILHDSVTELSPLHYLSIKSAFVRGGAERVYVHTFHQPSGYLWNRLNNKDNLNVKYVHSEASAHYSVKHPYMKHALYTLLQHGGIAHFGDVMFMSALPETIRSADAIVSPHYSQYRLRHRSINTDIIAASRGSSFVESMLAMVRQEKVTFPEVRVDDIASHVAEQIPQAVALEGRLTSHQVCHKQVCAVQGGHAPPKQTFTTRLLWKTGEPTNLEELKEIQSSVRAEISAVVDA